MKCNNNGKYVGESNVNNNITTIIIVNKNSIYSSKLKPIERKNGITKMLKKKGTKGETLRTETNTNTCFGKCTSKYINHLTE